MLFRSCSTYLNKPITTVHTISQIICPSNVAVERLRIELGEDINLVNPTIDAVTHGDINQSITSPYWNLKDHVEYQRKQMLEVFR